MPPSTMRGRPTVTEHIYDGDRLVRTVTASPWTPEDRALMLARVQHHASMCTGCGEPRERAWHPAMEGWYDVAVFTCQACAALGKVKGGEQHRGMVRDTYDDDANGPLGDLPPLSFSDPEDLPTLGTPR